MNTTRTASALAAVALVVALLASCAQPDHAIFVTKTSLSLIDVDSAPAGVSFAYDRVEGYAGPRFDDGTVYPVAGAFETDGGTLDRGIRQVFAAGNAARLITSDQAGCDCPPTPPSSVSQPPAPTASQPEGNKVVLFGTGTVLGVKIGVAENLPSLTLGFKRREAALIPLDRWRQPSLLASFDSLTEARLPAATASASTAAAASAPAAAASASKFRVEQFFATGVAADNLARQPRLRELFVERVERAIGEVEKYRNEEAKQGRVALDTLACFVRVDDAQLDRVFANAEALGVLSAGTVARIRAADTPLRRRDLYTGSLRLLDADKAAYTRLLELHQARVCTIAGPRPAPAA